MESFLDALEILPKNIGEKISNEDSSAKATVSNEESSFEQLVSQLTNETTSLTPTQENGIKLEDPQNVEEILSIDDSLISPNCHNVSIVNAACQHILKQMEHQLMTLLKKNRKEQEIIQNFLNSSCKNTFFETPKKPSIKCIGMPYFKDTYGFQPPPNEDVCRKERNKKLLPADFLKKFPIWNSRDSKKLVQAVKEYEDIKGISIDWMKISATNMEGKYSPSECKAKWTMHLNPKINKSRWSYKEMALLKKLSAKYDYQNWDKIAEDLNTNRNGLQCCIQYHTNTAPTEGKWTNEEDKYLKELVEKFRVRDFIPWMKVAWHFEKRSLKQCQERYTYHLGNIKRGYFTMAEDFAIAYLATKLKNFGEVAKFIPNRVSTQVRARYEYLVGLSMPEFTKEEDELLMKLMIKHPRNWGKISENFKNRSRVQCRRRWACLQKKIHLDMEIDNDEDGCEDSDSVDNSTKQNENNKIDEENLRKNIPFISKIAETKKKYSEVYKKLLDYHKNCHKFLFGPKPRIPSSPEELKKLTEKIKPTMRALSVTTSSLSGFNKDVLTDNLEFNKEDFAVLESLGVSEQDTREFELSNKIIPPNYMTLVGLRTLTLNWDAIQNMTASHSEVQLPPFQTDSNERLLCSDAKKLFKSRLKTLFAFPLILSNVTLNENKKPVQKPKVRKTVKPLSKRRRKEHAKFMSAIYRNKLYNQVNSENSNDVKVIESNKKPRKKTDNRTSKSKANAEVSEKSTKESAVSRKRAHSTKTEYAKPLKKRVTRRGSFKQEPDEL